MEGSVEWQEVDPPAPFRHRMKLILTQHDAPHKKIEVEAAIQQQGQYCKDCLQHITSQSARFCFYTGLYYCHNCHKDQKAPLPAQIVYSWNICKYSVCNASYDYLQSMFNLPCLELSQLRPDLYQAVGILQIAMRLRIQLNMLYSHTQHCHELHNNQFLIPYRYYLTCIDSYSLCDMVQVIQSQPNLLSTSRDGDDDEESPQLEGAPCPQVTDQKQCELLARISSVRDIAMRHIRKDCKSCLTQCTKVCGICKDSKKTMYVFDVNNCVVCKSCNMAYHKDCLEGASCPSCTTAT
eukprot:TRINITY_DN55137_c0_g1_i2.p1 TRINITY_DN55137_c0_g1~~TRINITY_DN55137_c0_g1_i2.p1  ORF type:complete len:294 (-),score=13.21 TRINITY_DN55137_c0_g1_i2:8-889(-)